MVTMAPGTEMATAAAVTVADMEADTVCQDTEVGTEADTAAAVTAADMEVDTVCQDTEADTEVDMAVDTETSTEMGTVMVMEITTATTV